MTARIHLDRSLCDGNGLCAGAAPAYFRLDANDELEVMQSVVRAGDDDMVRNAMELCPKAAITLGE